MAKQYKYQKIITPITTYDLVEPDYELLEIGDRVQYLGRLEGYSYVSVPDGLELPEQPVFLIEADYEADKEQAYNAAIVKQRTEARHLAVVENLPKWATVANAVDGITNLAQARAYLKKLSRVVYWLAKNAEK